MTLFKVTRHNRPSFPRPIIIHMNKKRKHRLSTKVVHLDSNSDEDMLPYTTVGTTTISVPRHTAPHIQHDSLSVQDFTDLSSSAPLDSASYTLDSTQSFSGLLSSYDDDLEPYQSVAPEEDGGVFPEDVSVNAQSSARPPRKKRKSTVSTI